MEKVCQAYRKIVTDYEIDDVQIVNEGSVTKENVNVYNIMGFKYAL